MQRTFVSIKNCFLLQSDAHFFLLQLSTRLVNWLFCGPCIQFLKTSTTFHKMTLTGVTLLVTSLLVASPILFLISAAPSMPHRDGCSTNDDCIVNTPPPECQATICKNVAASIQAKINWSTDVCKDFKAFSCSEQQSSLRVMKSPQEIADHQMLRKFDFLLTRFPPHYIQFVFIKLWAYGGVGKAAAYARPLRQCAFYNIEWACLRRQLKPLTPSPTKHTARLTRKH